MKFLIAGLGSIGRRHLRNLRALGETDILLYRTRHSTLPDDELAGLPVFTDLHAALHQKPDAVIVANPTALHLDVAIPAARAGCHLLLEKPIAHNLDRVNELVEALRQGGGQALTGFQFRFHPGLRQVRAWLEQGAIGKPASARAHWGEYLPNWHPWEDYRQSYSARADLGGGVVLTLSHPLDYLRWLLGEVDSLAALLARSGALELDVEDTAEISLGFRGGAIASLHLDYLQRPGAHHLEIVGSAGTIRWDNADGAAHLYRAERQAWECVPLPEGFERNQLFLAEMDHFRAVMGGQTDPVCSLNDGIMALELALAAHRASESGHRLSANDNSLLLHSRY